MLRGDRSSVGPKMRQNRRSRWSALNLEGLESRAVCNGSWASSVAAEISALKLNLGIAIQGTIHGTVTSITPLSSTSELVTYTAQGKANIIGDGRGGGHHVITSKAVKNRPTNDTYSQGFLTVTGTTDEVDMTYTGSGHTQSNGSFTAQP